MTREDQAGTSTLADAREDEPIKTPDPERAAFDAWFAAATFETMGADWQWAAWQAGAASERKRMAGLARRRSAETAARIYAELDAYQEQK